MSNDPDWLTVRPALSCDLDAICALAHLSVACLLPEFLDKEQMAETGDFVELDPWLVKDGTYYVAVQEGRIIGSGGWSGRNAHIRGPNATPDGGERLDPSRDPARIRAMYTHPDFVRCGIGRSLLSISEAGARLAGFKSAELIASLAGERLYRTCGWEIIDWIRLETRNGPDIPAAHMRKTFARNG